MCLEKVGGGHVNLKAIHTVADPHCRAVPAVRRPHFVLFGRQTQPTQWRKPVISEEAAYLVFESCITPL